MSESVSRDQILRRERGHGIIHFSCSADHKQDWQPYPIDPASDEHTCTKLGNSKREKSVCSAVCACFFFQERWDEMDWDSNGDISFGEFVYAFTKWVDVEHGDEGTNNTGYTQCNKVWVGCKTSVQYQKD